MKKRLDTLLVEKGLVTGREKAKELIKNGQVFCNNICCNKASMLFEEEIFLDIKGETLKYVSRGGLKLEKAINTFSIDLNNKICADIGASTGGFTDCMLMTGAETVYSVDVGHGQLAHKLINDNRVINLEGINVRNLSENEIKEKVDFISIDVSFISLSLVIPVVIKILKNDGSIVCLVKPQFEAGKENVGKKGVVKSEKIHNMVLKNFISMVHSYGLFVNNLTFSPIKGPEGNIEYLAFLSKVNYTENIDNQSEIVKSAFRSL